MPRLFNTLWLTVLASFLWCANIPGQFDTIYLPNEVPEFWLSIQNDVLGVSEDPLDNNRTYSFNVGFKVKEEFVVAIDYASLTNFSDVENGNVAEKVGPRIDEITLTVGRDYTFDNLLFVPMIGVRFKGNFGGEAIQEQWHSIANNNASTKIVSEYEKASEVFVAGFSTRQDYHYNEIFGYTNRVVASITTTGELQAAIQTIGTIVIGHQSIAWAGLRYDFREGDTGTETANNVADLERGASVVFGLNFGEINVTAWNSLEDSSINSGSIGFRNTF